MVDQGKALEIETQTFQDKIDIRHLHGAISVNVSGAVQFC
ncbi:hypothetical protein ACVMB3_005378 [Sinorhizobium meliloti]|jgi:hypothetical protein|nr:hypothetical protein C770_GR4pC0908 [Sinorhizobium meliloti GR4]